MRLCRIMSGDGPRLALAEGSGVRDLGGAGFPFSMDELIAGKGRDELKRFLDEKELPLAEAPVFADIVERPGKLVCVGLNYRDHAQGINMKEPEQPILFSKFADALAPAGAEIALPSWETSYDYEAELVVVMGKSAWNVKEEEAFDYVFGYSCGNDLSCREAQMRSGQWLIGKTMPGFGPCGPWIVTADEFDVSRPHRIKSRVNGELRQDGSTGDMIFSCARIISYASRYMRLEPGDLIFTGTPSGVALEGQEGRQRWLCPGDRIDVEIEGIGTLTNTMV